MMGLGLGLGMSRGGAGRYAYNGNFAALRALPAGTAFARANAVSTYIDSAGLVQVAGADVPRFTYDPTTRASLGLMAEESRINIITHSRNMTSADLSLTNATETTGYAGIDGTANALKIEATASAATTISHTSATTATSRSISCWMKQGSGATTLSKLGIRNGTTAADLAVGYLNFSTGAWTWTTDPTTNGTKRVEQFPGGWWRVSVSVWAGITATDSIVSWFGENGGSLTAGDYTYFDGLQIEQNPFPTSYMPTSGAAVTRSADVCSYTWADTTWQAAAFTVLAKWRQEVPTGTYTNLTRRVWQLKLAASWNSAIAFYQNDSTGGAAVASDATTLISLSPAGTFSKFAQHRVAMKIETNSTRIAIDGGAVVADTSCAIAPMNVLVAGGNGSGQYQCGTIAELKILKRGYSDAELQAY